ncbi:hypothetical protein SDC9_122616 [bioreactor metagenome]|uniref:Stage II sporulation protein M n=1 Tax=bioreactor metagenome TaxID=1076179 RepID=A0A645CFJ0_9ZZZZ
MAGEIHLKTRIDDILNSYFYKNIRSIIIMLLIYTSGIFFGVIQYRLNVELISQNIFNNFNDYFKIVSEGGLAFKDALLTLMADGFWFLSAAFICSFVFIGILPIAGLMFYKGMTVGYGMCCAIAIYRMYGNSLLIWQIALWNIAVAPFFILFCSDCSIFSVGIFKTLVKNQVSFRLKKEILLLFNKYLINLAISAVLALITVLFTIVIH